MKITLERFVDQCKENCGEELISILLYGSSVGVDKRNKNSDINVLILLKQDSKEALSTLKNPINAWVQAGNPPPLIFGQTQFNNADDVFPIEFMDIQMSHSVLFGHDPFSAIRISTKNLRHQIEYELRGRRLQLARLFLTTEKKDVLFPTLAKAVSSTFVLMRSVLRLVDASIPTKREDIPLALQKYVDIDSTSLIGALDGITNVDVAFTVLLNSLDKMIEFVDQYKEEKK